MIETRYDYDPDNIANSASNGADGPRLSPAEDFVPVQLAGMPAPDAGSAPDGDPSRWAWVEQEAGKLYRFRIAGGSPSPSSPSSSNRGGETTAVAFGEPEAHRNTVDYGGIGPSVQSDAAGPAIGNTTASGTGSSATSSVTLASSTVQIGSSGGLVFNI